MRLRTKAIALAAPLVLTVALASCTTPTKGGPPTGAVQVAVGGSHTCALLRNGTVSCWGRNDYGQLGNTTNNGTFNANPTPTAVAGLTGVTRVIAGGAHTCALLTNHTVTCWGQNGFGQLGNTTNNGIANANPTPTAVAGLTGVTQVTAGDLHTCALLTNHTVTCWGENQDGQLGNATDNGANPTPTAVAGLTGVTQITADNNHTCALLTNHTVTCWGDNLYGQLGNTTNDGVDSANPAPTAVASLTGVTQITAGDNHTCALLTNHTVTCWGYNYFGQLGNTTNTGTFNANPTPTAVAGLTGVTQVTAGDFHTCALLTNHTVTCWGLNFYGQLGNTTNNGTDNANATPASVAGLTGVEQIAGASEFYTCALLANRTVTCWGHNGFGQLGNTTNSGTNNANPTPTAVPGIP